MCFVALCGMMTAMYYPVIIAMSSRINKTLSNAVCIGNGICYITIIMLENIIYFFEPEVSNKIEYE